MLLTNVEICLHITQKFHQNNINYMVCVVLMKLLHKMNYSIIVLFSWLCMISCQIILSILMSICFVKSLFILLLLNDVMVKNVNFCWRGFLKKYLFIVRQKSLDLDLQKKLRTHSVKFSLRKKFSFKVFALMEDVYQSINSHFIPRKNFHGKKSN